MGLFKKIGGFFGRLWDKAKRGIKSGVGFIRNKVLPVANKLKTPIEAIGNVIAPGMGTAISRGIGIADKLSGGGYG